MEILEQKLTHIYICSVGILTNEQYIQIKNNGHTFSQA